jgi:hypothetical protein
MSKHEFAELIAGQDAQSRNQTVVARLMQVSQLCALMPALDQTRVGKQRLGYEHQIQFLYGF